MQTHYKTCPRFEANYKAKHLVARLKMVTQGQRWGQYFHYEDWSVYTFYHYKD